MTEFRMPSLGADMDEGTLVRWLVGPGDRVERGDVVAEIDTEKSVLEIEIFTSGVIEEILVDEGTTVPVGTVLATVREEEGEMPAGPPTAEPAAEEAPTRQPTPAATEEPSVREPVEPTTAKAAPAVHSPLVRRRASELGVDLADVTGTGPDGTITRRDVEQAAAAVPEAAPSPPGVGPKASPFARRRAAELGVDLEHVPGTGPDGSITARDVEQAAGAPTPPTEAEKPPTEAPEPPARAEGVDRKASMRRAIGDLMARSKREIPHYYLGHDIDLGLALEWLATENAARPVAERILHATILLKATALAVHEVPEMNGFYTDGAFRPGEGVHLGVAISVRDVGLIAPALHDADRKPLEELMADLRDLVKRARTGRLRGSEMSDPTITVTNLGDQGVGSVFGVIYPPQVALVGFGKVIQRPWARDGMVGARPVVTTSLSADHRASDGHRGGLFLAAIDRLLQNPEELR